MSDDTETRDPWRTDSSSGFPTKFNGTIEEAWFQTDPRYNDGNTLLLHWKVGDLELLEEGVEEPEDGTITRKLACGDKWVTEDGGQTASHPRKTQFHASSIYGRIIDVVTGAVENYGSQASLTDGGELTVDMGDLKEQIRAAGLPTEAKVWVGQRFRFDEIEFDYGTRRKGGKEERITTRQVLPVEYLGTGSSAVADKVPAKKATKVAAKKEAAPKAPTAAEKVAAAKARKEAEAAAQANGGGAEAFLLENVEGLDEELATSVIAALYAAKSQDAFVDAVLEIDGATESDPLMELVVDEEETGLWAKR